MVEKFIKKAIKHPGALHKQLHVPKGKKIPEKKLEKAEHSKNPKLKRRAILARTLKGMHKGKHKKHGKEMSHVPNEYIEERGKKMRDRTHKHYKDNK